MVQAFHPGKFIAGTQKWRFGAEDLPFQLGDFWVSCLFSGVLYIWKEYTAPPREKQKWESKTFVALKDEVLFLVLIICVSGGCLLLKKCGGFVWVIWSAKLFACFHPRGVSGSRRCSGQSNVFGL